MPQLTPTEIYSKLATIISGVVGIEMDEIYPESHFEEDLGISLRDFGMIVQRVNQDFKIDLDSQELAGLWKDEELSCLVDFVTLVSDEMQLG